jgi:DNA polymerase III subunit delta'
MIGHQKQKELLKRAIKSGTVSHGFLFQGKSGLGKKALVVDLFKEINNHNADNHPDLIFTEAINKEIQIKQIREIIGKASLFPYDSLFKFIVINDAHLMNQEASNSLLKVLEEPNESTLFFLITEYPELIYETVKSRVQTVKFFPLSDNEIVSFLMKMGCSKERAQEIAGYSFGRPGIALDFFFDYKKIAERKKKIKELAQISSPKQDFFFKFNYAKKISEDPEQLKETLEIWLSYLRSLLLEKACNGKVNYSFNKLKSTLELIEKTINLTTKTNVSPRLAMEALLTEL